MIRWSHGRVQEITRESVRLCLIREKNNFPVKGKDVWDGKNRKVSCGAGERDRWQKGPKLWNDNTHLKEIRHRNRPTDTEKKRGERRRACKRFTWVDDTQTNTLKRQNQKEMCGMLLHRPHCPKPYLERCFNPPTKLPNPSSNIVQYDYYYWMKVGCWPHKIRSHIYPTQRSNPIKLIIIQSNYYSWPHHHWSVTWQAKSPNWIKATNPKLITKS